MCCMRRATFAGLCRTPRQRCAAAGMVLLNEISGTSLFTHLTFGLLDGWWLYEDEELSADTGMSRPVAGGLAASAGSRGRLPHDLLSAGACACARAADRCSGERRGGSAAARACKDRTEDGRRRDFGTPICRVVSAGRGGWRSAQANPERVARGGVRADQAEGRGDRYRLRAWRVWLRLDQLHGVVAPAQ